MEWKPIGDQVLVKKQEKQEKTKSGIILTNGSDEFIRCEVVAHGDGLFTQTGDRIPMTVKVGSEVMIYTSHVGDQKTVKIDDVEYTLIRESEIAMIKQ